MAACPPQEGRPKLTRATRPPPQEGRPLGTAGLRFSRRCLRRPPQPHGLVGRQAVRLEGVVQLPQPEAQPIGRRRGWRRNDFLGILKFPLTSLHCETDVRLQQVKSPAWGRAGLIREAERPKQA